MTSGWILVAIAVGLSGWGAVGADTPTTGPATRQTFTGKLVSGQMAIGGEHTGWSLVDAAGKELYEVDVRAVVAQAHAARNHTVSIQGHLETRHRVERGETTVLVAQLIAVLD
jgi:hypothetical protein